MTTTYELLNKEQLQTLADGEITLDNGIVLKLRIEPDDSTSVNDFDCYGKIAHAQLHPYTGYYKDRPDGFDGCAELLRTMGDTFWWQPPVFDKKDREYWHTNIGYRNTMRTQIRDLLDFGFVEYHLTAYETCDCCGTLKEIGSYVTGGHEAYGMDDISKVDILKDMVWELSHDLDTQRAQW